MSLTYSLVQQIREKVNEHEVKEHFLAQGRRFSLLCSMMDTLEDTEEAVKEYAEKIAVEVGIGEKYIRLHGLLQAIYVQQNSFRQLCKLFNYTLIDFTDDKLREARNNMVAHPERGLYGINRPMTTNEVLTEYRFGAMSQNSETSYQLIELIKTYQNKVITHFNGIVEHLDHLTNN